MARFVHIRSEGFDKDITVFVFKKRKYYYELMTYSSFTSTVKAELNAGHDIVAVIKARNLKSVSRLDPDSALGFVYDQYLIEEYDTAYTNYLFDKVLKDL